MKAKKYSGRLVAGLRKIIGKSQSQFAAMVGVSKHTIISVENNRNKVTPKLARRILVATGADITDASFQPLPDLETAHRTAPVHLSEALKFLKAKHGESRRINRFNAYTRDDFKQWRANFYPSSDKVARTQFEQIKVWVEYVFRAAAMPGLLGNRDRLPAVRQSLVEWLEETRENFKLERELDAILEEEPHGLGEFACNALSLTKPAHEKGLKRTKDLIASYGYDFDELKKQCRKAKRLHWLVLETETKKAWDPFNGDKTVPCAQWRLLKNPKVRFEHVLDVLERMSQAPTDDFLKRQYDLFAEFEPHKALLLKKHPKEKF